MRGSVQFDQVADRYDDSRGGLERGAQLAADIAPHLVPGAVFEAGVGTGLVAAGLRALGRTVLGADLSAAMLARAAARMPGCVVRADAHALPLPSGSIPNIIFCHVLHLVADLPAVIAESARVLRPGGRLIAAYGPLDPVPTGPAAAPTSEGSPAGRAAEPAVPTGPAAGDDLLAATAPLVHLRDTARPDTRPAVLAAAAAAGLRPVTDTWTSPRTLRTTPNALAETIENRLWSYLWHLDDETWGTTVAPVIAALHALPDPDRPRTQVARMHLTVLAS